MKSSKINALIVVLTSYLFSNLAWFLLTSGAFPGIETGAYGKGFSVFSNVTFVETISLLFTPTVFSLAYVVLALVGFVIVSKLLGKVKRSSTTL
ncbi:hypothetical protein [Pseudalkalibacillus caeni]|uniref:Uncharacterized protein n=1 Tax=Exobacillus caeni TaxID=2574798 RepID=A0A5R9F5V1_9BACL|nr:hypothetical protein [Pseudalkalibacillus caeni]TLS36193.1 hypothetical protein FCL54_16285 [Pseudalkalibacillus caeni]